jgi:hypothetical protein
MQQERTRKRGELLDALRGALAATKDGRTAILNAWVTQ